MPAMITIDFASYSEAFAVAAEIDKQIRRNVEQNERVARECAERYEQSDAERVAYLDRMDGSPLLAHLRSIEAQIRAWADTQADADPDSLLNQMLNNS